MSLRIMNESNQKYLFDKFGGKVRRMFLVYCQTDQNFSHFLWHLNHKSFLPNKCPKFWCMNFPYHLILWALERWVPVLLGEKFESLLEPYFWCTSRQIAGALMQKFSTSFTPPTNLNWRLCNLIKSTRQPILTKGCVIAMHPSSFKLYIHLSFKDKSFSKNLHFKITFTWGVEKLFCGKQRKIHFQYHIVGPERKYWNWISIHFLPPINHIWPPGANRSYTRKHVIFPHCDSDSAWLETDDSWKQICLL